MCGEDNFIELPVIDNEVNMANWSSKGLSGFGDSELYAFKKCCKKYKKGKRCKKCPDR